MKLLGKFCYIGTIDVVSSDFTYGKPYDVYKISEGGYRVVDDNNFNNYFYDLAPYTLYNFDDNFTPLNEYRKLKLEAINESLL